MMLDDMVRSTKKVLRWLDRNKVALLKGVLAMMTITFTDGNVNIDLSPADRKSHRRMPDVKPRYVDYSSGNSVTAAIDMFADSGVDTDSNYYKLEAVEKIQEILDNTDRLSDYTKQHAIEAIGRIRSTCDSAYYRREMNDIVVNILEM